MKKKKLRFVIKKSACFFVASLIALIPLIGIPFTVSAADSSSATVPPPQGGEWSVISNYDNVGWYGIYELDSNGNYNMSNTVDRTYYGEVHFDMNKGPSDVQNSSTPTMEVYQYRLSQISSYTPVSIMQVHLKPDILFEPGVYYRITFDVTPAPGFAGWNKVYDPALRKYIDIPFSDSDSIFRQYGTMFYYFNSNNEPLFMKAMFPYTSAPDNYFGDTRYRFVFQFMLDEEFGSPQDIYLSISIPYVLGLSATRLTSYLYTPIVEKWNYITPDRSDEERLEESEQNLISFVDDNWDNKWFDPDFGSTYLGVDFLKGFKGAGELIQNFYSNIPWIRGLVFFSCTLGLAGFVLNMGTSIASKFAHRK